MLINSLSSKLKNISFWTNFTAIILVAIGYVLHNQIVKTVGLYAFSGALTNWLAIFMLFEKIPFVYGSGVIALRFDVFKSHIKNMMMETFFSEDRVKIFIEQQVDITFVRSLPWENWCDQIDYEKLYLGLVDIVMESKLGGMLGMFGGESLLDSMKPKAITAFRNNFIKIVKEDKFQEKLVLGFKDRMHKDKYLSAKLEDLIDSRLNELTPKMVKELVQKIIKEHLGYLVLWGGVFGGFIGLLSSTVLN